MRYIPHEISSPQPLRFWALKRDKIQFIPKQ